jgi:hypothetical protein
VTTTVALRCRRSSIASPLTNLHDHMELKPEELTKPTPTEVTNTELSQGALSLSLPLPLGLSCSEDDIPRTRCHSCSSSDRFLKSLLFLIFCLKPCKSIQNSSCNKVKFSEHFFSSFLICDVLCVVTSVMTPRNDPSYD